MSIKNFFQNYKTCSSYKTCLIWIIHKFYNYKSQHLSKGIIEWHIGIFHIYFLLISLFYIKTVRELLIAKGIFTDWSRSINNFRKRMKIWVIDWLRKGDGEWLMYCRNKRHSKIDQQIARYFVHYSECLSNLPSLPCNSNK